MTRLFVVRHGNTFDPGDVVTRAEIFDKVWGTDWLGDMRTLDVHMSRLRKKLGDPNLIQTVWGIGYRLAAGPGT